MAPFASLIRRFRRLSADDLAALEGYRQLISAALARAPTMRDQWLALTEIERDDERIANVAAVGRWELVRLSAELEAVRPPRHAEGIHRALVESVAMAARACQLLATGHRFHTTEAMCDGQALLLEAADGATRVQREIDRLLARSPSGAHTPY